jgi:hypothetical protein
MPQTRLIHSHTTPKTSGHQGILCHLLAFFILACAELPGGHGVLCLLGPFLPELLRESRPRNESPVQKCRWPDMPDPHNKVEGCASPKRRGLRAPLWDGSGGFPVNAPNCYKRKFQLKTVTMNYLSNAKLYFWSEEYSSRASTKGTGSLSLLTSLTGLTLPLNLDWSRSRDHNLLEWLQSYANSQGGIKIHSLAGNSRR